MYEKISLSDGVKFTELIGLAITHKKFLRTRMGCKPTAFIYKLSTRAESPVLAESYDLVRHGANLCVLHT